MFRKSLFLGLTMMLVAVLVYLVIQGRRQEKRQEKTVRPVEIVQESAPSLTRVIGPDDLEILESKTEIGASGAEAGQPPSVTVSATHRFTIRNNAHVAYHGLGLRLSYLGRGEKTLETRTVPVSDLLQPGQARVLDEIKEADLPAGTLKCRATIAYADLEPSAKQP